MRIAIHDYAGFSFPLELSAEFSKRGHDVLHLFTKASGGPKASFKNRSNQNLQIVHVDADRVNKDNFLKRWTQERSYGDLAIAELADWHPDAIISGNTPLEAQKKIMDWACGHCVPAIYWLHDLLSVAAESILFKNSRLLSRFAFHYLNRMEIKTLAKADHIVSITDDFAAYLHQWDIDMVKVSVIPNWGPIEQIPVLPRKNPFSDHYGLNDKFIVLYAGTLGKKQDIPLIADTVARFGSADEILFVIATDQRGQKLLERHLPENNLANLLQLPLQPSHLYPYLLASADVSLVTLDSSAGNYCVPSKLWSAYCAQRPSIVSVDRQNASARTTEAVNAGIVIPPGSADACIRAIRILKEQPSMRIRMGKNARGYAEKYFPIHQISDAFETILHQIVYH